MSEIDDIFARLGGRRITTSDQRDLRDIPRKGKAGGSRIVEVVHLPTRRTGLGAALPRRIESSVRAQTWDGGFPAKAAPQSSQSGQAEVTKAPEQVGHVITRGEPTADAVPISQPVPEPGEAPSPVDQPNARSARGSIKQRAGPIADPFNPKDDRANCLRCGYAVERGRARRGLMTCAACAG